MKKVGCIPNLQEYAKHTFFSNFYRNLVGKFAVGRLAASFEPTQPTANLQTANQISMKKELETKNLHFRANLLCTPSVLVIAYYFPPMATVGTVRNRNIAYWYQQSFSAVEVLTTRFPPLLSLDKIDLSSFNIHRVWNLDYRHIITFMNWLASFWKKKQVSNSTQALGTTFSKYNRIPFFRKILDSFPTNVLIGEGGFLYIFLGILKGICLVKKNNITHLHSSYRPYSDHVIAFWIKIFMPHLVWIADFRDVDINEKSTYCFSFQQWSLKTLLKKAAVVTTVSEGLKQALAAYHNNIYVLRNGVENLNLNPIKRLNNSYTEFFTITYTGSLYAAWREPSIFLKAIQTLIIQQQISSEKIRIIYAGKDSSLWNSYLKAYQLDMIGVDKGLVSRQEALELQSMTQVNLLLTWCSPEYTGILTSKIFEYFAANRPIIAFVKGNQDLELETLFQTVQAGKVTYNQEAIEAYLLELYQTWEQIGNVPSPINQGALEQYTWESQMAAFLAYLQ
ncbi:MAG: hypothetical protein RLZZ292_1748 [Bacteroidota bacterium]|jgi:hypothetical protein